MENYNSPAKNAAREIFWRVFVLSVLSREQIRTGRVLVLLAHELLELDEIFAHGIDISQICNIEKDPNEQAKIEDALNIRRLPKSSFYRKELVEFLKSDLTEDSSFRILNLDIEGQFCNGIYDGLMEILLYCYREPETVVATYYSAGRQRTDINQGLLSLGFFLSLGYQELFDTLQYRFTRHVGSSDTGAHQTLRFLYWWRAHLDHFMRAEAMLGNVDRAEIAQYHEYLRSIWSMIRKLNVRTITKEQMLNLDYASLPQLPDISLGVNFSKLDTTYYHGRGGRWIQNCLYTKFDHLEKPQSIAEWVEESAIRIAYSQTTYADKKGKIVEIVDPVIMPDEEEVDNVVWSESEKSNDLVNFQIDFSPFPGSDIDENDVTARKAFEDNQLLIRQQIGDAKDAIKRSAEANVAAVAKDNQAVVTIIDNFQDLRDKIIEMHEAGASALEIIEKLNLDPKKRGSVVAIKAHATRRAQKAAQEVEPVDSATKEEVRECKRIGMNAEETGDFLDLSDEDRESVPAVQAHVTRNLSDDEYLRQTIGRMTLDDFSVDEIIAETKTTWSKQRVVAVMNVVRKFTKAGIKL